MNASRTHSEIREYLSFVATLALIVFLLRGLVVAPFNIPSESMQPRLLIGDYLLVAKWPYGYSRYSLPFSAPLIPGRIFAATPERGDVIVFKAPSNIKEDWIKRVVGLPGDTVQVRDGVLFLNGLAVRRQRIADFVIPVTANMFAATRKEGGVSPCFRPKYERRDDAGTLSCHYPRYRETMPNGRSYDTLDVADDAGDNTPVVNVPANHVFVMGDNRDRSADSRVPSSEGGVGLLPMINVEGRALVSVFSTDGSASWLRPWTWLSATRAERIGEGF